MSIARMRLVKAKMAKGLQSMVGIDGERQQGEGRMVHRLWDRLVITRQEQDANEGSLIRGRGASCACTSWVGNRLDPRRGSQCCAIFLVAFLAFAMIAGQAGADQVQGRASVMDGDTIEIKGQRIRLFGIDAPEGGQACKRADGSAWRCGRDAAFALSDRIAGAVVTCDQRDTDRYGRIVAVCVAGGDDLNGWMVASGWAVAFRRYSRAYVKNEDAARAARRGLWSGSFEMPWDWRRAN